MLDFMQKPELWWGLTVLLLVLFAIASFPKPSIEALPWLLFAAVTATVALLPAGTLGRVGSVALAVGWDDHVMRWHLIVAAVFAIVIPVVTVGMTGFVPVLFTGLVTHPLGFFQFASTFNRSALGDNAWPFLLLSAFAAPWAFPAAWSLISHSGLVAGSTGIRAACYVATVTAWWIAQSIGFSFLMFKRSLFW
jgi:hypothetical protein